MQEIVVRITVSSMNCQRPTCSFANSAGIKVLLFRVSVWGVPCGSSDEYDFALNALWWNRLQITQCTTPPFLHGKLHLQKVSLLTCNRISLKIPRYFHNLRKLNEFIDNVYGCTMQQLERFFLKVFSPQTSLRRELHLRHN